MSKHQLTISPSYVQDWTYVEAVRELFQNALDNEIVDKSNKMYFNYNPETETLNIGNKTSKLEVNTLLMGYSSKRDDEETIGRHGEGYKVALMVLLREGKTVTIQNYGKKEVWTSRLIKSRKYNGELITEITIQKNHIFKSVPHNDLEIIIGNITQTEYENLVKSNLNLQPLEEGIDFLASNEGKVLLKQHEKGNIYVAGLFISHDPKLHMGYSFNPASITLDRDRRLIKDFDLQYTSSKILVQLEDQTELLTRLIKNNAPDIQYLNGVKYYATKKEPLQQLEDTLVEDFIEEYGDNAIPVTTNEELEFVSTKTDNKPILVTSQVKGLIEKRFETRVSELKDPRTRFLQWFNGVSDKLTGEEKDAFNEILNDVHRDNSDVPF